eukprot:symbB.v1.2.041020.t1/scaffold7747.1/size9541/1
MTVISVLWRRFKRQFLQIAGSLQAQSNEVPGFVDVWDLFSPEYRSHLMRKEKHIANSPAFNGLIMLAVVINTALVGALHGLRCDWYIFFAGVLVGLFAGPIIDLLYLARHNWIRSFRVLIEVVRAELEALQVKLNNLEEQVEEIGRAEEESQERVPLAGSALGRSTLPSEAASWSAVSEGSSTAGAVEPEDRQGRERLAAEIGRWIRRALGGDFRGTSGRDRLRLQNRLYLIFSNFEGIALVPPLYVDRFSEVRRICKRGSDCGRAVFVGVAAQWEAEIVFREAGFHPPPLRHV